MNLSALKSSLFSLVLLVAFTSCSTEELNSDSELSGISVKLKSTGGEFDKVFMDIIDVQLKVKDDDNAPDAWVSLNSINKGAHNIFDLRDDSSLVLVNNFEFKSSYIYEIRLVLGDNNFIDLNNTLYNLDITTSGNSNPSNLVRMDLIPNRFYDITIDIDIDKSLSFDEDQNMMVLNPDLYTEIRQVQY
jgi:hypothetical protein